MTRVLLIVALITGVQGRSHANESLGEEFVQRFCTQCHGSQVQEADLRLDQFDEIPPADQSERWRDVWRQVSEQEMPPEDAAQPSQAERDELLHWISKKHGEPLDPRDIDHWSLKPLVRPQVPSFDSAHNPIDAFVFRRLAERTDSLSARGSQDVSPPHHTRSDRFAADARRDAGVSG